MRKFGTMCIWNTQQRGRWVIPQRSELSVLVTCSVVHTCLHVTSHWLFQPTCLRSSLYEVSEIGHPKLFVRFSFKSTDVKNYLCIDNILWQFLCVGRSDVGSDCLLTLCFSFRSFNTQRLFLERSLFYEHMWTVCTSGIKMVLKFTDMYFLSFRCMNWPQCSWCFLAISVKLPRNTQFRSPDRQIY